jgi:acyl-CoA reductase-like NAD-dependent aldehyde dehydrogenase/4-aminobutyrate aminotransferase-like enzyme
MVKTLGQGNFINGSFLNSGTITLTSENPSCDFQPVFSVKTDLDHVPVAINAAKSAYKSWRYLSQKERRAHLLSLKAGFIKNEEAMAEAISLEMGKIKSEALTESKSLSARIDLMLEHGLKRVKTEQFYDLRAETRYHSQGVMAVIGPYNFPAHLVNAHVIPSIMLGNTVVIKPSEVCPMVAEIYAQSVKESSMPAGVINIVHGRGDIGRALCAHEDIDGVLFTGSYETGRALKELLLDQPHKILALEMGGKNFAVVMDDADLEQTITEVVNGAFLTTGQRCTATSRLLVHDQVYARFKEALTQIVKNLKPTKSFQKGMFGPLATKAALTKFMDGLKNAQAEGVEVLVQSEVLPGGAFVTPSLYEVRKNHPVKNYLGKEIFGPNLCIESFSNLDEAIVRINESPFGLSNSIFTSNKNNCERMFFETKSGVLNLNRSTNNAYGQMPFGGVNKSGNQRPAGIDAVKYATFPTAITSLAYGETTSALFKNEKLQDETPLFIITLRHQIEKCFELYGIYSDQAAMDVLTYSYQSFELAHLKENFFSELRDIFGEALVDEREQFSFKLSKASTKTVENLGALLESTANALGLSIKAENGLKINVPTHVAIPRSRNMLDRLYKKDFVPAEKKSAVIDLTKSRKAYLVSVDDDPLVLFDAASQISTMGTGFLADAFQNSYDNNELDLAAVKNVDLSMEVVDDEFGKDALLAKDNFESFFHEKSHHQFKSVSFGSSGAEANEIALDLCRRNGQNGTRILAFESSFHGRTIMALQATYNKEKRGPFLFAGYEATFLPFPEHKNPDFQPELPKNFLVDLSKGEIPHVPDADALLKSELFSLAALKAESLKGNICAVIIEPMQCEGGDRYASNRFFCGLRALTRALKLPLIFDEVQTGFHLGREFFWYQQMKLVDQHGQAEHPDCLTVAKKAQLGVCLSQWENPRTYSPHVAQLKRGLLHGQAITKAHALETEKKAKKQLLTLQGFFSDLVLNPRACGFAFAFDMPTKELATYLIDQRFHHGFMAYIAGEKTLRFRLNTVVDEQTLAHLFEKLVLAISDIRDQVVSTKTKIDRPLEKTTVLWDFMPLTVENFTHFRGLIETIENSTYEPGRRDTMDYLLDWLKQKDSVGVLAKTVIEGKEIVAGYAIGGPLEHSLADGPNTDPHRGANNTFYSANITVNEQVRGCGLGRLLKNELIKQAGSLKTTRGARYLFMNSRNRVGKTAPMNQINDDLGAYLVKVYDNQYNEDSQAAYVRLPLRKNFHQAVLPKNSSMLDCQNTLQTPFQEVPKSLWQDLLGNNLRSILGSKLTLSNWATPHLVRYSELLRALMPAHLNHTYFTSGRDEVVDKGLRSLRFHRPLADIALGFSHQWLGHTTAAARSLSHDENQAQPFHFFDWPHIPHPSVFGASQSLEKLEQAIKSFGPERILGLMVELMGEKTALGFDEDYLKNLDNLRKKYDVPLVFVENTSSFYRSGQSLFLSDHLSVKADMCLWYTGGQLGHVFTNDRYFVKKPLTLISTWDGDELSIARAYHHLLYANMLDKKPMKNFISDMDVLKPKIHGQGLCYAMKLKNEHELNLALEHGKSLGVLFGKGFDNSLVIMAKPDFRPEQFTKVFKAVASL